MCVPVEAARVLVELGANVNAQNNLTGATPLHMVAQSKKAGVDARLQVIDILLDAGAYPDQADKYGTLPVHSLQLSEVGNFTDEELDEQTRLLVAKLQPRLPKIFEAISDRNLSMLEAALVKDSTVVSVVFQGETPLSRTISDLLQSMALESSNDSVTVLLSIIKKLLSSGADPNCVLVVNVAMAEDVKEPALHKVVCALREKYKATEPNEGTKDDIVALTNVITDLTDAGATIPLETTLLLHQAARFNECTLANFLIDVLQIDPNTKGRQGMTPLQFAARSGQLSMLVRYFNCNSSCCWYFGNLFVYETFHCFLLLLTTSSASNFC
jgi:regulator of RNase E activity RraB